MNFRFSLPLLYLSGIVVSLIGCSSPDSLHRITYQSEISNDQREYFLYLPKGYDSNPDKKWPVILFLHGNGERGNGTTELEYALKYGPATETWAFKRNLPFIIITPQLHMFGMDTLGIDYLTNRTKESIPKRLANGIPSREPDFPTPERMMGSDPVSDFGGELPLSTYGWDRVQSDLINMLDNVLDNYNADSNRVYLTGLSYGGFGTWYMGSNYPDRFAAIAPVVGWGHPSLMPSIAEHNLPVWVFAGGRDFVVEKKYFYEGLNVLEGLGHNKLLFTVHEDMGHDAWKRVYAGNDLYMWFLTHKK